MGKPQQPLRPCLDWPTHEALIDAQHLRTRVLWQALKRAVARLCSRLGLRSGETVERIAP